MSIIEQRIATTIGNFGLLAFLVVAAACWLPWPGQGVMRAQFVLVVYAALVLSFLGGIHWGLTLAHPQLDKPQSRHALWGGVAPLVLGWLAAFLWILGLLPAIIFAILLVDFGFSWAIDIALRPQYPGLPEWYVGLRRRLTIGAMLALAIAVPSPAAL